MSSVMRTVACVHVSDCTHSRGQQQQKRATILGATVNEIGLRIPDVYGLWALACARMVVQLARETTYGRPLQSHHSNIRDYRGGITIIINNIFSMYSYVHDIKNSGINKSVIFIYSHNIFTSLAIVF